MSTIPNDDLWLAYPFSPDFWRTSEVARFDVHLAYFGPLPQTDGHTAEIAQLAQLPGYVYVIQDVEGDPLYVGKTVNPIGRFSKHRCSRPWWPRPGQLTLLGIEASTSAQANRLSLDLERLAIHHIQPRHNIAGVRR